MGAGGGNILQNFWNSVTGTNAVDAAFNQMISGAGDLIQGILPYGIGLMFVLMAPRIIRRVVNAFM